MQFLRRFRWPIIGVGVAVLVVAFLAFRPDKLFVDDVADESLADAFTTQTTDASMPADETSGEDTGGAAPPPPGS